MNMSGDDPMDVGYDSEEEVGLREVRLSSDEEGVSSEDLSDSSDDEEMEREADNETNDDLDTSPLPEVSDEEFLQRQSMVDLYPRDYGTHLLWIDALRWRHGRTATEVRAAREAMHSILPLAEEAWMQWMNDELLLLRSLAHEEKNAEVVIPSKQEEADGRSDVQEPHLSQWKYVEQLVHTAQHDFISVPLWQKYLIVVERRFASGDLEAEAVRAAYEEAIGQCGKHFTDGHLVWEQFLAFEKGLEEILKGMVDGGVQEVRGQLEEQKERIRTLYGRQLATPMLNLKRFWVGYKSWETTSVRSQISKGYNRALKFAKEREPYEKAIADSVSSHGTVDLTKLTAWVEYLRFEERKKNAHRVTSLYERAVKIFYNVESLWHMYTAYVDYELGHPRVDLHVRCCRNVPWSGLAWGNYLRALERSGADELYIFAAFKDQALVAPLSAPAEYLPVYQAYFDFYRRNLTTKSSHDLMKGRKFLRQKYKEAVLRLKGGGCKEALLPLLLDRARTEASWTPAKVKDAWETVTKEFGAIYTVWIDAAQNALFHNDIAVARDFLSKGAEKTQDWPEKVLNEWKGFEREHGSSEDWFKAMRRITILERLVATKRVAEEEKREEERMKNSVINNAHSDGSVSLPNKSERRDKGGMKGKGKKVLGKRNRSGDDEEKKNTTGKKQKKKADTWDTSAKVPWLLLSGLSAASSSDIERAARELGSKHGNLRDVRVVEGDGQTEAFLLYHTHESAQAACAHEGNAPGHDEQAIVIERARRAPPGPKVWFDDSCTAFVKNLPYDVDEAALRELFSSCAVKEIRVLLDKKTKKSKGLAYIEMESSEELEKALELNDTQYGGRTLKVLKSKPTSGRSLDAPPPHKRQKFHGREHHGSGGQRAKYPVVPVAHPSRRLAVSRTHQPKAQETNDASDGAQRDVAETAEKAVVFKPKSNDDFRKMLLGGK